MIFDADTHLYEEPDCFTRHLPQRYRDRALRIQVDPHGRQRWHFREAPTRFVPDDIGMAHRPGDGELLFRDSAGSAVRHSTEAREYRDPVARIHFNRRHGVNCAAILPNIGLVAAHEMRADPEACVANLASYNDWLLETWGFDVFDELFAVPVLPTASPPAAASELSRLLVLGARAVVICPGPWAGLPPGAAEFDAVWSQLADARVPAYIHITQSGYTEWFGALWSIDTDPPDTALTPLHVLGCFGARPMEDMFTSLAMWGVFDRWPEVTLISAENGASFVDRLWELEPAYWHYRSNNARDPSGRAFPSTALSFRDLLRRHLRVVPPPLNSARHIVSLLGEHAVLFGSDYPHPEGLRSPSATDRFGMDLSPGELASVMHDNARMVFNARR